MTDLTGWVQSVAKAIAALLVPFVLYGLGRFAEWVGMDVPDRDIVETATVAGVSAVIVWAVRNRPTTAPVEDGAVSASVVPVSSRG